MIGSSLHDALAPVVTALREDAQGEAAAIVAAADAQAREGTAKAQADSDAILAQARADGETSAENTAAAARASARREQRETLLAARRRAYETVRADVLAELARRRDSPEVAALIERLATAARARLGPDAVVQPLTAPRIGVVAVAGDRRVEATADALVDAELARAGDQIERLWA